jgi:hypothetical protein
MSSVPLPNFILVALILQSLLDKVYRADKLFEALSYENVFIVIIVIISN